MATALARTRSRERLERLSRSSLDSESLRRTAIAELRRIIGFDRWCWPLADPKSLLPPSGIAEHDYGPGVPRALALEYSGADFAAKHVLARRANPAGSLGTETRGDLARSARWDQVMRPVGIGDVATVACRDSLGVWGWIEAYRDRAEGMFAEDDLELFAQAGDVLGPALRRTSVGAGPATPAPPRPPGVVVLDRELRLVSLTASARSWLDAMPEAKVCAMLGIVPPVIYPAATLARTRTDGRNTRALARTVDGAWLMIDAARLEGRDEGDVAIALRMATASETFEYLCRVFALSRRERDVASVLLAGFDTRGVATQLFISPHTVQDHLKSIFEKVGVHSRRELLTRFGATGEAPEERP
jgi:DNA-binding CsgD family transcriptional regulator